MSAPATRALPAALLAALPDSDLPGLMAALAHRFRAGARARGERRIVRPARGHSWGPMRPADAWSYSGGLCADIAADMRGAIDAEADADRFAALPDEEKGQPPCAVREAA